MKVISLAEFASLNNKKASDPMRISKETKCTQITVDRIEGEFAVCETQSKQMIDIPITLLPEPVNEGNIYEIGFTPLDKEKEERKKKMEERMNNLWVN